jgi:hypothetical protein
MSTTKSDGKCEYHMGSVPLLDPATMSHSSLKVDVHLVESA